LAFSQGFGTIVGTVSDPSGGVVASAKVTATESATGVSREATANTSGDFVIPGLRPTTYTLTVESPGFNKFSQQNISLTADQSVTVNVALSLGQTTQAVTVETSVAQVDTYTSTLKEVVDSQRMIDLPLNGRNAAALATLVPGATLAPNGGADQGQQKTFPGAVEITTNGSRQNMVAYNLDGIDNVDRYTNVNMPFPFPDALQEFSVQTANYSSEYGGNAGGVVNVITKSGTNAIHGDFFGFLRNGDLNARNYFAAKVDPLKRGQEGGTIGGPVIKNKTFFFAGYQATTVRDVTNGLNKYSLTQAEEAGDFSALLTANNPNNPLSKATIIKDPTTGLPFPNNQIPVSRFDPAAIGVTKFLPSVGGTGIVFYSSPLHQNFQDVMGRADHIFSEKDHLSSRYDYQVFTNKPVYTPTNILSYADGSDIVAQNAAIEETHIFSTSLLNEFRVGFNRAASIRGPAPDVPSVRTFGVNIPYQPANDVQSINVSGFFTFGDNPFARFTRNNFLFSDNLRWVKGRNNFSMGANFERRQTELDNGFNSPGLFTFNGTYTGLALSDFVLGDLYQFQQAQGQFENSNAWSIGFFIQDDYKVSSRLTLNMGVRYEPYFPWHEVDARVEGFSIANYKAGIVSTVYPNAPPGLLFRGDAGFPTNGVKNNYKDWAPRIGFAWDVFGDGKTSLRGGGGIFYDSATNGIFNNNMVDEAPFAQQILLTPPPGPFSNPYLNEPQYTSVFPAKTPPPKNVVLPAPVTAVTFNLAGGAFAVPVNYSWNLTLEHQFGNQWLGRVAYVGSHSTHLSIGEDLNPSVYIPGSTLSEDKRVIYPGYGNIELLDESGNSHYNSLQLTIQKRLAHGVSVLANYTWQRSIDNMPPSNGGTGVGATGGASGEPLPWFIPGNNQLDYGVSDFNRSHVFVVSYLWDIPKPATSNKFVNYALGGWELTGIVTAETGLPFTIFAGKDISQTGLNVDRGVYLGGNPTGNTACHSAPCVSWLNTAAFGLPAAGTVGNVGKSALVGPGLFNWDIGAFKNFAITERWRVQLRGEFFNTLNHTNLTNASNNYPNFTVNSGGFGTITNAYDPRILQLALKVFF
jgi:hypothetical protein